MTRADGTRLAGYLTPFAQGGTDFEGTYGVGLTSRPQVGDVIEIPTPKGLAYAQYTHKHRNYGELLRVFRGFHELRPEQFDDLVRAEPQFSTCFPLGPACAKRLVRIVASELISVAHKDFPTFRAAVMGKDGAWGTWWLWDGEKEWPVGKLSPGMELLPLRGIIDDTLLVERIVNGWRHEHDA